jgi:DNA-binding NtrC family response regulator
MATVMASSMADMETAVRGTDVGAINDLGKPLSRELLRQAVERHCGNPDAASRPTAPSLPSAAFTPQPFW